MKIYCVSENNKKIDNYLELQKKLASHIFELIPKSLVTAEIQSVDGKEVILNKMAQIRKITEMPFIVDDVSLVVGSGSYPGALIKHLLKNNDHSTLTQFLPDNASATVICYIGYFDGFENHVFRGEVSGVIRYENNDSGSVPGLDSLVQVNDIFLGSIDKVDNHRGKAFMRLVEHIKSIEQEHVSHNTLAAKRWGDRAKQWQSVRENLTSYVNHEKGYERFNTEVERILPLVTGSAVDIGCGDGFVTRLIGSNLYITEILGIDISSEMIKAASEKTSDSRIIYKQGIFSGTEKKYGLITSRGVVISHMHHSEIIPTFTAMAESLAPNGYLVFDFISNLSNNDDKGRTPKNQLDKEWISDILSELGLVNISYNGSPEHRVSILVFHKPTEQSLYFATSNATKVIELQSKCKNHTLHLANIDVVEIKNDDIIEIAKDKARKSYEILKHPVIATDGGIFINALKGFPGQNSKQAAMLLGPKKILALLADEADRTAIRRNCMVFYDGKEYKVCVAEVQLVINTQVTESEYKAYPLDTILVPLHEKNSNMLTYKQMPVAERVQFTELPFFEEFISTL